MNYIVFDLEWNQSPGGRYRENPKLPFEILQAGFGAAVSVSCSIRCV